MGYDFYIFFYMCIMNNFEKLICCDFDMQLEAIENEHLEYLQRAYKKFVWNEEICNHAAGYGQLECL